VRSANAEHIGDSAMSKVIGVLILISIWLSGFTLFIMSRVLVPCAEKLLKATGSIPNPPQLLLFRVYKLFSSLGFMVSPFVVAAAGLFFLLWPRTRDMQVLLWLSLVLLALVFLVDWCIPVVTLTVVHFVNRM
jgi:hypothetical protein